MPKTQSIPNLPEVSTEMLVAVWLPLFEHSTRELEKGEPVFTDEEKTLYLLLSQEITDRVRAQRAANTKDAEDAEPLFLYKASKESCTQCSRLLPCWIDGKNCKRETGAAEYPIDDLTPAPPRVSEGRGE